MSIIALSIEILGMSALVAALAKNTLAKRKATRARDHTKNTSRYI